MEYRCFLDGVNRKEEQAWAELYDYFYAPLCCYSTKIIGDAQVAEDIVQNILIKLWHSNLHFNEIKVITAYLYHSVYNTSLNYIRDKQRAKKFMNLGLLRYKSQMEWKWLWKRKPLLDFIQ